MPESTRVLCTVCRAQLGAIVNDRLTVDGHLIEYSPRAGLVIVCTTCKTVRPWEERKSA